MCPLITGRNHDDDDPSHVFLLSKIICRPSPPFHFGHVLTRSSRQLTPNTQHQQLTRQVKLVLAAAMWQNPHMLIMDEPTNYLDRWGAVLADRFNPLDARCCCLPKDIRVAAVFRALCEAQFPVLKVTQELKGCSRMHCLTYVWYLEGPHPAAPRENWLANLLVLLLTTPCDLAAPSFAGRLWVLWPMPSSAGPGVWWSLAITRSSSVPCVER